MMSMVSRRQRPTPRLPMTLTTMAWNVFVLMVLGNAVYGWTTPSARVKTSFSIRTTTTFSSSSSYVSSLFLSSRNNNGQQQPQQQQQPKQQQQQQEQDIADGDDTNYYYRMPSTTPTTASTTPRITLTRFLSHAVKDNPDLRDVESLLLAVSLACKTIANLVNRAGLVWSVEQQYRDRAMDDNNNQNYRKDGRFYSMKRLDQLSTIVLRNALSFTGKCHVVAPTSKTSTSPHDDREEEEDDKPNEHQPGVLIASALDSQYVACLDPLDGSGNADASICTGTVFGVFENERRLDATSTTHNSKQDGDQGDDTIESLVQAVLQPGRNMRAAGYCLYSSATVLVFTLGNDSGVHGFTLDPQIQDFVLTHPNLTIPPRGTVYSCNEANAEGWNHPGWKEYLKKLKLGQGQSQHRYAHRYVGSMVGDIHRTLLYGGLFAYPSDSIQHPRGNLQLLYKSAPMAFVVHHAGGKACNEQGIDLLDVKPSRIHAKEPVFIGSPLDIEELKEYLQQQTPPEETSSSA